MKQKIFVIDDDPEMIALIRPLLIDHNYEVESYTDPQQGLEGIKASHPDCLLLDIRMPVLDGLEVCKTLRANSKTNYLPIIMISVQAAEADVVAGLEVGADDYVSKPVRERELIARIKSVIRRKSLDSSTVPVKLGPFRLKIDSYEVTVEDQPLLLAPKEFELLAYFLKREGQVLTRSAISRDVWEKQHFPKMRTIDTHVDNLRKKLGKYGRWIKGLRGIGYRFEMEDE